MIVVTPGLLQRMSKKCNSPGEFPGLVVFLAVFFRKFYKKSQIRESLLYSPYSVIDNSLKT